MRWIWYFVKGMALTYLVMCLVLSAMVSMGIAREVALSHRQLACVVEVCVSTVEGMESDGHMYGFDQRGDYIGFGYDEGRYSEGQRVVSFMLWNPMNNYCDDIIARGDVTVGFKY